MDSMISGDNLFNDKDWLQKDKEGDLKTPKMMVNGGYHLGWLFTDVVDQNIELN